MKKISKKVLNILLVMAIFFQSACMITGFAEDDVTEAVLSGSGTTDDPYKIGTLDELNLFKEVVNGDNPAACAELVGNIWMGGGYNPSYGMGSAEKPYTGTFDGKGYYIEFAIAGGQVGSGLFNATKGATIKNLELRGSLSSGTYGGAVVGIAEGGTFENIISSVDVSNLFDVATSANQGKVGGLIGQVTASISMTKCAVTGNVTGGTFGPNVSGLIAENHADSVITNCYVSGNVTGGNRGYGLSDKGSFTNCYFSGDMLNAWARTKSTGGTCTNVYVNSDADISGGSNHANNNGGGTAVTAEQFANGEVAYLLGDAFGQIIGTDATPVFATEDNKVYESKMSGNYTNANEGTKDNPYRIGNKDHLATFANLVKAGETGACAIVTADITDNAFVNGSAQIATTQDAPYTGTFDGAGHTIKLNHGGGASYKGLFAYIKNATVKNVNITGAVGGQQALAGIAAVAESSLIENCTNSATIFDASNGSWSINDSAGIVGKASGENMIIKNCANFGEIGNDLRGNYVGGIVGNSSEDVQIINCYNTGAVKGTNYVAGIGYLGTFTNCYSNADLSSSYGVYSIAAGTLENTYYNSEKQYTSEHNLTRMTGTAMTAEQFENGEVAYLLGDAYGQIIGTDVTPVFINDTNKVYTDGTSYFNNDGTKNVAFYGDEGLLVLTSEDISGILFVTVYNEDNSLASVEVVSDFVLKSGEVFEKAAPTLSDGQYYKVFLWNDYAGLTPVRTFVKL